MAALLKALIVDDEPIARRILREELELVGDVQVIGEAEDGEEALAQIAFTSPDLVFLDLQMPGMGGFEVVQQLQGGRIPVIVIVTAYDQHALEAFDAGAIDYLLKPVSQERLRRAVEKARRLRANSAMAAENFAKLHEAATGSQPAGQVRKLVGRIGQEYFLLDSSEVLAFQADGELVWIVTLQRRYLATQTLRALEEKLGGTGFCRIHRNALVNVNHIRKMSALSSHRWLMTLCNNQEFVVSKRRAQLARSILNG